ncbi:MAG: 3-dehydroquinate synthase [Calditerrivibrio sp.]|nr:3-dehydroquinate synthase [Calditerrivibrio sp.]
MEKIRVSLSQRADFSYDIIIGNSFVAEEIRRFSLDSRTHLVVDKNVFVLYGGLFDYEPFLIEADEHNKTFLTVEAILNHLKNRNCLRGDTLIAIGGGIVGDIAGFSASIYMRGIGYIQVPTTLLSMVDSSVGGKTGVNLGNVKNLVGTFYQPKMVLIDTDFLETLSEEEYKSGLAEVIKYAVLFDKGFYDFLLTYRNEILNRNGKIMTDVVKICCDFKRRVVEEDETEKGIRRLLNLGHTFGHGLEVDSDHGIKHGLAVAWGMYMEALFAAECGFINSKVVDDIFNILTAFGYNLNFKINDLNFFLDAISSDKKAKSNGLVLALTSEVGNGIIIERIDLNDVKNFFEGAKWMRLP